jgi:flagellar hook assembly protein FlgD
VTLRVYDVSGRLVRTLVDGRQPEGVATATWDGRNDGGGRVASGVYFYRLEAGDTRATRRMVLLK